MKPWATRSAPVILLVLCAGNVRGDLSYDLRETTIAHPSLGLKSKESLAHVVIQGKRVAVRQNDMVAVVDPEMNQITLIDYRTQTFATSNLDAVRRDDDQGFDSIAGGIRSELVQSGEKAVWNGVAVKRDVARTVMTGGEVPGSILVTSDWIEDVSDFAELSKAFGVADERHAQEIEAEIQTMVLTHGDRFADGLKIRKDAAGRSAFEIHSLTEMRLAADAPMLQALGPEYRNKPIMSVETEVLNLSASAVDAGIFFVPGQFKKVEFSALLAEKVYRHHH